MVHLIGAGCGAADLITLRGKRLLETADVILYAGSLVNRELLSLAKPGCQLYDSAEMTLDEVLSVIEQAETENLITVRLHSGDPSLYGAIGEQMREFDRRRIAYDITPGVSALSGAAAALKAEYTLPGVSQTVILTRVSGNTEVPPSENLSALSAHGATMVLFLSTGLLEKAQRELLAGGLSPDTPAAIVYKATWPDEKILRCTVSTLAGTARANRLTKTALIAVGKFLDADFSLSRLYDPAFSTGFRTAQKSVGTACETTAPDSDGDDTIPEKKTALFCFSDQGARLAIRLCRLFSLPLSSVHSIEKFAAGYGFCSHERLSADMGALFSSHDLLLFIGACGIAARSIAPCLKGKAVDPAVLVVDDQGRYVIPLLSGHIGGANDLARRVAQKIGALPVITTATDSAARFSCDAWAAQHNCALSSLQTAKEISAAILTGDVGISSEYPLPDCLPLGLSRQDKGKTGIYVGIYDKTPYPDTLRLIPRIVTLGIGCRRDIPAETIARAVTESLQKAGIDWRAVCQIATIDLKRSETGLLAFAQSMGLPIRFYSAQELAAIQGPFSESAFVERTVGVGCVCERAAVCGGGSLLLSKTVCDGVTVAAGRKDWEISF